MIYWRLLIQIKTIQLSIVAVYTVEKKSDKRGNTTPPGKENYFIMTKR